MSLEAIFFDIDDTLYSSTDFAWRARERAIEAMIRVGLQVDPELAMQELTDVVSEFGSNDDRHYNRLLDRLPASATEGANRTLLVMAGVIAYHETKWRELSIRPQARAILDDLKATTEVKIGVISAGITSKQIEKILRIGMARYLDPQLILITDQVGIAKTNPKLYFLAAERAGVEPGRAMMVGDHPEKDIHIANQAGFITVWHRGKGKYAVEDPATPADHVIDAIGELRGVLQSSYGLLSE